MTKKIIDRGVIYLAWYNGDVKAWRFASHMCEHYGLPYWKWLEYKKKKGGYMDKELVVIPIKLR